MFELLQAQTDLNESNQHHAAAYGALIIALIDKGIITQKEYDRAYIQAQHEVSQEFARKRDEAHKETMESLEKESPTLARLMKPLLDPKGDPP